MKLNRTWIAIIGIAVLSLALVATLFLANSVLASGPGGWFRGSGSCGADGGQWGSGMMGDYGAGDNDMMGSYGAGSGMMGGDYNDNAPSGPRISLNDANDIAARYAAGYGSNLEVSEVMEFSNNFYAEVIEKDTGTGAFEILINPYTGYVHPEPGPNMMWNEKYGMHGGSGDMMGGWGLGSRQPSGEMTVSPEQASVLAQQYLDRYAPDLKASDEADRFYGYYTLHTLRDGEIAGMLSVNGYTGQVWYHNWHGDFLGMTEEHGS